MHSRFEMSMMGELKFFLGLQIHQSSKGIFINQVKYALDILKKHGMKNYDSIGTPMTTKPKLDADLSGIPVDQTKYRSMIGSLMYLTSSRSDIVQATCFLACYQARTTKKHLKEVKRIFWYLKKTIHMGLIDNDLFTYDIEVPKPSQCDKQASNPTHNDLKEYEWNVSYDDYEKIYAEAVIFINKRLVRLIDVTLEQWLDLKYGSHVTMDENIKKEIWIGTQGDDEVKLSDKESSDPNDENPIDENDVAKIFRIETNVFDFKTPTCKAFKEFNYLLQINPDVLTKDIDGFKTYEDYKDDWIYEWNEDVPWVHEKPWTDNGQTSSWKDDGYCNGGNLPGAYIVGNTLHYQDLEWYEALEDGKLKDEALLNKAIMEGTINEEEESLDET
ncbi:VIER F-box protein 2 [Tanacetum coccineum]|uniref:VIER F-box protein 2 n=1 Tax=Tanacetum coccineum TaxID=301880 RepID=A0ABQ5BUW3_9ASTR